MEQYDPQLASRVWQRVQGKPVESAMPDVFSFLQEESADLSRYLQLQSALPNSQKPFLQQLIQTTRHCIAILQGILFFLNDTHLKTGASPLPKELPVSTLRRCYGGTLQRIVRYSALSQHPEYAPGFLLLEQLSRERCQLLLQLLGKLQPV